MVKLCIIQNQETVVCIFEFVCHYFRVLAVVFFQVEFELFAHVFGVDCCEYVFFAFAQQGQYRIVNIIINQDDGFFCAA